MILSDDKKTIATIIARRRSSKGETLGEASVKPEVVKHEDGSIDGRHVAAEEAMMALSEKSPEKFMRAMANFHDLHVSQKASEPVTE